MCGLQSAICASAFTEALNAETIRFLGLPLSSVDFPWLGFPQWRKKKIALITRQHFAGSHIRSADSRYAGLVGSKAAGHPSGPGCLRAVPPVWRWLWETERGTNHSRQSPGTEPRKSWAHIVRATSPLQLAQARRKRHLAVCAPGALATRPRDCGLRNMCVCVARILFCALCISPAAHARCQAAACAHPHIPGGSHLPPQRRNRAMLGSAVYLGLWSFRIPSKPTAL